MGEIFAEEKLDWAMLGSTHSIARGSLLILVHWILPPFGLSCYPKKQNTFLKMDFMDVFVVLCYRNTTVRGSAVFYGAAKRTRRP